MASVRHLGTSSPASVLVIGEALIDVVVEGDSPPAEHVGGSPANVALGLARLDVPVRLRTCVGRDARGARITQHLAESGVQVDPESFILDRTSTALARISPDGNALYEFDIDWRIETPVALGAATIVHVGSIGCYIEPGARAVREALRSYAGRARVTFDPNIRPALVGDRASAVAVTEEIASACDLVKLSDEDAAWLYPGVPVVDVAGTFIGLGARIVAITLGSKGAIVASRESQVAIASRPVKARDTVGAGDTFMASMIASLAEGHLGTDGQSLRAAGASASIAASITVSRVGADLPTRAELARVGGLAV